MFLVSPKEDTVPSKSLLLGSVEEVIVFFQMHIFPDTIVLINRLSSVNTLNLNGDLPSIRVIETNENTFQDGYTFRVCTLMGLQVFKPTFLMFST